MTSRAKEYLQGLKLSDDILFYHIISILNAPRYRTENAGALRQDWPRVLLPATAALLKASAELGNCVAELHDPESKVKGVTSSEFRPELKLLGVTKRVGGGSLAAQDLAVSAGWGHPGKGGITMPGKGRLHTREYSSPERQAVLEGASLIGLTDEQALIQLGSKTHDVYINEVAYWTNIPVNVWEYTIGGYQVIKKWLSYREEKLLGRPLSKEEVRYVQEMVRRIAAILLLNPALDANYRAAKAQTFS